MSKIKFSDMIDRLDEIGGVFTHVTFFTLGSGVLLSGQERVIFKFHSIEDFLEKSNEMLSKPYNERGIQESEERIP